MGILMGFSLITLSFTFQRKKNCSKVKQGSFYYYSKDSRDKVDIERSDSMQLETVKKTGQILKNKIVWNSDCVYTMYINALSNSKLNKMDSLLASIPISVDIFEVNDQYYVCRSKFTIMGKERETVDTIYIVHKP